MSGETILDVTRGEMERVAEAMSSIMTYLEDNANGGSPAFRLKFQADIIVDSYQRIKEHLPAAYSYVVGQWNSIIVNELYQHELKECIKTCKDFRSKVEAFDDCFSQNLELATTVFANEWIARQYLEAVLKLRDKCQYIENFVNANFKEREFASDPFVGSARRFKAYFSGVSDASLRSLVEDKIPLPRRAKWLGDRREATIFGKTLGLKCSLMNKSFIFLNREGMHRDLNYSSDGTDLNWCSYDITPILGSLTAARE